MSTGEAITNLVNKARNEAGFDNNGSIRAMGWKGDVDCPAWRLERIKAVEAWGDLAWMKYYELKTMLLNGLEIEIPTVLERCPYKFSDLLQE